MMALLFLPAFPAAAAGPSGCAFAPDDRRWLDASLVAWRLAQSEIVRTSRPIDATMLLFDARCRAESGNAFDSAKPVWSQTSHAGTVDLPGAGAIPAAVTSFAAPNRDGAFFVMAVPTVWRKAGVDAGALGLDRLTTAVFLHEAIHLLQFENLGARITRIAETEGLGDDFSDDSIQERFGDKPDFAESISRETELLLESAAEADEGRARALAMEALALLDRRRARYFTGNLEYLREAEDIWHTLEGAGQWVAYRWLLHPRGGAMAPGDALQHFGKRGSSWSQKHGLALILALDRVHGGAWHEEIFGRQGDDAIRLLRRSLKGETRL